jgi:ribose transport system substrate-binding protein
MNKKKCIIGFAVLVVFLVTVASISIYRSRNRKVEMAVIVKSTTSTFWQEFMNGLKAGTVEYSVDYYCEGPDNEENIQGQLDLIQKAIDNEVDVIVVSATSAEEAVPLIEEAKKCGIYVIIADSGVNTNNIDAKISSDNMTAGGQLAEQVINIDEDMKYVGIINFDESAENAHQREQGFRDAVERRDDVSIVDSVNVASNVGEAKAATVKMLAEHPEINVIVTMNEWTTLGVGYAVQEMTDGKDIYVYGFDSNTLCLDMLEKGYIDGLLVQNPYAMGYLAMETGYRLCKGKKISEKVIYTSTELVTRDNMYDQDIQKIIFPIKSNN